MTTIDFNPQHQKSFDEMSLLELLEKINDLKEIPRSGWVFASVPMSEVEDVAQHSFEVASISLLLCDELDKTGVRVNREKCLWMAIIHDWPEAIVADFPYTAVEYLGGAKAKHEMERRAAAELLDGKHLGVWQEYVEKKSVESRVVHAADYISMLLQAVRYRERGNNSKGMMELLNAVLSDISQYSEEFQIVGALVEDIKKKLGKP